MATLNLDKILNYINPEPRYAGKLEKLGLLEEGDLEAARNQSIFQGLLGAGLGYLAQPKNQGYGTIAPYLAKAGMQGLQASKAPYEQLTQDALMNQKLKEIEKQNDIENILSKGLYTEKTTGGQERPYKPITKQVMSPTGLIDEKVAPDFTSIKTTPEKTTYEFNLGAIQDLVKRGGLTEASALMNIEKARKEMLKSVKTGMMLSDSQASGIGLKIDRGQKYFVNKDGKPELIAGQIIPYDQINKSKYERVSDAMGTFYIPKDPTSGLKTLRDVGGGNYVEDVYKKPSKVDFISQQDIAPFTVALREEYPDLSVEESYNISLSVLDKARQYKNDPKNASDTRGVYDVAKDMVKKQYKITKEGIVFIDDKLKEKYPVGMLRKDPETGRTVRVTGYDSSGNVLYKDVNQ